MTPEILRDTYRRIGSALRRLVNCEVVLIKLAAIPAVPMQIRWLLLTRPRPPSANLRVQFAASQIREACFSFAARVVGAGPLPERSGLAWTLLVLACGTLEPSCGAQRRPRQHSYSSAIALLTLIMTHRAPGSLQTLTKMLEKVWLDPELDRDHSARPDDRSSATTFSR